MAAGIGYRHELAAGVVTRFRYPAPEVLHERKRFDGGARLGSHNEHGASDVDRPGGRKHGTGVGRVQNQQFGGVGSRIECLGKYLRGEARSTHPEDDNVCDAVGHQFRAELLEFGDEMSESIRQLQPTESVG